MCSSLVKFLLSKQRLESVHKEVGIATKLGRAFVALVTQVPGLLGSSLKDVEYIAGDESTCPQIIEDTPAKAARMFAARMRKPPWSYIVHSYMVTEGLGSEHGPALVKALTCAAALLARPSFTSEADFDKWGTLVAMCQKLPTWRGSFRKGSTDTLEDHPVTLIQ